MKLNDGQQRAFEAIKSGRNVFLTGQAGTGKSELIKVIKEYYESRGQVCGITSLTGNSAMILKGTTIHRWSGYGIGKYKGQELLEKTRKNRFAMKNWKSTHLLVIDEVSMMSPDMLDALDFMARNIRRVNRPFGGLQLLLSADMCQLPPVKTDAYCFESKTWALCDFDIHYLRENMRQSNREFQAVLAEIRMGVVSDAGRALLQSRLHAKVGTADIIPTKLFPKRASVDTINMSKLKELIKDDNKPEVFPAIDYYQSTVQVDERYKKEHIEMLNKSCQAKTRLELCVGAQVVLIHNLDIDAGLCNGSRGVIIGFEELRPVVRFMNGIEMIIQFHDWEVKLNDQTSICRRQIPLILGYAMTIHKAQGMSLDCVEVDLGLDNFADGQFYTALSRVRTVEGLSISDLDFSALKCDHKVLAFYKAIESGGKVIVDETGQVKSI